MPDVAMPRLSDSMEEGTILKWIVEEGGEVKRGEPLCEIETDKANMTYEADTDGTLIEIVVPEGETVALGEVIDPRTLRPLDLDTILASVRKTNRCVIVEEGWPHGGVGANLAALIQGQAFDDLDAPIERVTGADVPMPYSKPLEQIAFPHEPQIIDAVLATLGERYGGDRS